MSLEPTVFSRTPAGVQYPPLATLDESPSETPHGPTADETAQITAALDAASRVLAEARRHVDGASDTLRVWVAPRFDACDLPHCARYTEQSLGVLERVADSLARESRALDALALIARQS